MKRASNVVFVLLMLASCTNHVQTSPTVTPSTPAVQIHEKLSWKVYDQDPDHIWNRVFRQLYLRTTVDGKEYGLDELDPLLWFDTTYLLTGRSHQQAIQVLDEFLSTQAENLINDPLKRAMFQRDLWAVFDWLAIETDLYPSQRQELKRRLAKIIQRVALTKQQIASLPDNYSASIEANAFPDTFQIENPTTAFLPPDLFQEDSAWVPIGRAGGPIAITHTNEFPFFGRSVFLVFVRSPNGRTQTLDFVASLNTKTKPDFVVGSEVALVRRMLLIDDHGEIVLSPIVETIQIRHFSPAQSFYEFELDRARLLHGNANTLQQKTELFMVFLSNGDIFERDHGPSLKATIPDICKSCHLNIPGVLHSGDMQDLLQTIISYSRANFALLDNQRPVLSATTWEEEAETVIDWKLEHYSWQSLEKLWNQ